MTDKIATAQDVLDSDKSDIYVKSFKNGEPRCTMNQIHKVTFEDGILTIHDLVGNATIMPVFLSLPLDYVEDVCGPFHHKVFLKQNK